MKRKSCPRITRIYTKRELRLFVVSASLIQHPALFLIKRRIKAISLSRYLAISLSRYPAIQLSSYPAIQLSSYPAIQLSSYPAIQLSSYPAILLSCLRIGMKRKSCPRITRICTKRELRLFVVSASLLQHPALSLD